MPNFTRLFAEIVSRLRSKVTTSSTRAIVTYNSTTRMLRFGKASQTTAVPCSWHCSITSMHQEADTRDKVLVKRSWIASKNKKRYPKIFKRVGIWFNFYTLWKQTMFCWSSQKNGASWIRGRVHCPWGWTCWWHLWRQVYLLWQLQQLFIWQLCLKWYISMFWELAFCALFDIKSTLVLQTNRNELHIIKIHFCSF